MSQRMLVWDIPTRVFHWLLAVSFAGAFLTAESERYRDIHVVLGYTLLGLIAFRLVWGFVGSRYARFRSFLFKPGEIAAYLRSLLKARPEHHVGHNPAGSVAVFALLALGIASGVSGVMIFQDVGGDVLEELHELVSYGMLAVVVLHVAGVLVSSVMHRENLVRSMVTGFKRVPEQDFSASARPNKGIRRTHAWLGVIMLAATVTFWAVYPLTGPMTSDSGVAQGQQDSDRD
ncbi:MAG TPA: cytochrome b/b6 domain-containing protein [Gallionella sp.]|nr:cytochrome b/b6 domain-containing protein [Gallionella sp.]